MIRSLASHLAFMEFRISGAVEFFSNDVFDCKAFKILNREKVSAMSKQNFVKYPFILGRSCDAVKILEYLIVYSYYSHIRANIYPGEVEKKFCCYP